MIPGLDTLTATLGAVLAAIVAGVGIWWRAKRNGAQGERERRAGQIDAAEAYYTQRTEGL